MVYPFLDADRNDCRQEKERCGINFSLANPAFRNEVAKNKTYVLIARCYSEFLSAHVLIVNMQSSCNIAVACGKHDPAALDHRAGLPTTA